MALIRRNGPSENMRRGQGKREDLNICEQGSSRPLDRSIDWCMALSSFFFGRNSSSYGVEKNSKTRYSNIYVKHHRN